jgi:hypothetical protein
MAKFFLTKRVNIRGIGEDKLIVIEKKDYDALPLREKRKFRDP